MKNEEILKAVIKKAVKSGYSLRDNFLDKEDEIVTDKICADFMCYREYFSHRFAEAFWGEQRTGSATQEVDKKGKPIGKKIILQEATWGWQYHLRKMVLKEEPLKYLQSFLTQNKNENS